MTKQTTHFLIGNFLKSFCGAKKASIIFHYKMVVEQRESFEKKIQRIHQVEP